MIICLGRSEEGELRFAASDGRPEGGGEQEDKLPYAEHEGTRDTGK